MPPEELDEHSYRETPVRRVGGDWHPRLIGTHTIHRAGGFDVIDGRLWLRRGRTLGQDGPVARSRYRTL